MACKGFIIRHVKYFFHVGKYIKKKICYLLQNEVKEEFPGLQVRFYNIFVSLYLGFASII